MENLQAIDDQINKELSEQQELQNHIDWINGLSKRNSSSSRHQTADSFNKQKTFELNGPKFFEEFENTDNNPSVRSEIQVSNELNTNGNEFPEFTSDEKRILLDVKSSDRSNEQPLVIPEDDVPMHISQQIIKIGSKHTIDQQTQPNNSKRVSTVSHVYSEHIPIEETIHLESSVDEQFSNIKSSKKLQKKLNNKKLVPLISTDEFRDYTDNNKNISPKNLSSIRYIENKNSEKTKKPKKLKRGKENQDRKQLRSLEKEYKEAKKINENTHPYQQILTNKAILDQQYEIHNGHDSSKEPWKLSLHTNEVFFLITK